MKVYVIAFVCGGLAFVLAGHQIGLFAPDSAVESTAVATPTPEAKTPPANFPEDLAPAARGEPVEQAAELKSGTNIHRLVFLKSTGELHNWQDRLSEEWAADTVETTELVVVLGPSLRTLLSIQTYVNHAPPVYRYKYEREVSVVEAKTGRVLANRLFINMPREIKLREAWELTALGQEVSFNTIFQWVVGVCRNGFPSDMNPGPPLINVLRD